MPDLPISAPPAPRRGGDADLPMRVRAALMAQAQMGGLTTYRDLADRLGLTPPQTIRRLTDAIEVLMHEDVAAGRPILAALCVSRLSHARPGRGFFIEAARLGRFDGDPEGDAARIFHQAEAERARGFYTSAQTDPAPPTAPTGDAT